MTITEIINRILKVAPEYKSKYSKFYNHYRYDDLFELMVKLYRSKNIELKFFIIEPIDDFAEYYLIKHPEIDFQYFNTKEQAEQFVDYLENREKGKFKVSEYIYR